MKNYEIKLHDIKPLVEIQDDSLYYFLGLVGLTLLVLITLAYFLFKWYKHKNSFSIRKEHLKFLKKLDMENAKLASYQITSYGATFKNDSDQHLRTFEELIENLQEYKYKKNVQDFDEETKNKIRNYLEMIDVS